jgi:hypothetical protein
MNYHKNMLPLNTLSRVNRLTLLSLYFGEEKGIKTEVGEVHETLRKKETKGTERDVRAERALDKSISSAELTRGVELS